MRKTGGQRIRLTRGELDSHPHGVETAAGAWRVYLDIAAKVQPNVLTTLLTDEALAIERRKHEIRAVLRRERRTITAPEYTATSNVELIRAWCEHWGFWAEFAETPAADTIEAAYQSLATGTPYPDRIVTTGLSNSSPLSFLDRLLTSRLSIDLPELTWTPTAEELEDARARIMATLDDAVTAELDRIQRAYLKRGYSEGRTKRSSIHFEWFARAWLLGESDDLIADSLEGDNARNIRTVERGIADVREALGLEPRPRNWRSERD